MAKYKWWKHKDSRVLRGTRYTLPTFSINESERWDFNGLETIAERMIRAMTSPGLVVYDEAMNGEV